MSNAFTDKDTLLWENWQKSKSPGDLQLLLNNFRPTITTVVNKWAGSVPRDALESEAKKIALGAFSTYDPSRKATLNTHVNNQLLTLSRFVYSHQNTAKMPENLVLKMHSFNTAKTYLTDLNGQEPTAAELHQELGWSLSEINRIQTYDRKDLTESFEAVKSDFFDAINDIDEDILTAVYYDLTPTEKIIFEHSTGFHNTPILSNPALCKKVNLSQAQLSYQKRILVNKIQGALRGRKSFRVH